MFSVMVMLTLVGGCGKMCEMLCSPERGDKSYGCWLSRMWAQSYALVRGMERRRMRVVVVA